MSKIQKLPWRDIVFVFGVAAGLWGVSRWSLAAAWLWFGVAVCCLTVLVNRSSAQVERAEQSRTLRRLDDIERVLRVRDK